MTTLSNLSHFFLSQASCYLFGGSNCYTLFLLLLPPAFSTPARKIFHIFLHLSKSRTATTKVDVDVIDHNYNISTALTPVSMLLMAYGGPWQRAKSPPYLTDNEGRWKMAGYRPWLITLVNTNI